MSTDKPLEDIQPTVLKREQGAVVSTASHSILEGYKEDMNTTPLIEESSNEPIVDVEERSSDSEVGISDNDNFKLICRECVIRDLVGCIQCGIYQYGLNHKYFNIKATRL